MQTSRQEKQTDKERLFSRIRRGKVTLFIGSGFSLSAGAPKAEAIVDALKKKYPDIKKTELKDVADEFMLREGDSKDSLLEIVQSLFPEHALCDNCQQALTRIPHFKQIFTTNYDSYIEAAYAEKCHVVREEKDMAAVDNNLVQIYKLHGDFIYRDGIVITQRDYNQYFETTKNSTIWSQLRIAMMSSTVVFIGYSLDDHNVFSIIEHIRNICGETPHDMFMITPSNAAYKTEHLKKKGITWINNTAEKFLAELEQNIKENIFRDFRSRYVNNETFIQLCNIHGFNPVIRNNEESNEILQIQGIHGKKLDRQISISLQGAINGSIWESLIPLNGKGFPRGTYSLPIPKANILSLDCRINGLKELDKDDVSAVSIILQSPIKTLKIKIPSRDFISSSECEIKKVGNSSFQCIFDFDICTMILDIELDEDKQKFIASSVHVETNDTYCSQENALRWVEVIDAIASGEPIIFPDLGKGLRIQVHQTNEDTFKLHKEYYKMVKSIELYSNISFSKYYNCSQSRYINALKLYYWLNKQEFCHQTPDGADELVIKFHNEINGEDMIHLPPSYKFRMVVEHEIEPIMFNDKTFTIPHDYVYFDNCNIEKVEMLPDGSTALYIHNPSKTYHEILTSTPKFNEGNPNLIYFRLSQLK